MSEGKRLSVFAIMSKAEEEAHSPFCFVEQHPCTDDGGSFVTSWDQRNSMLHETH